MSTLPMPSEGSYELPPAGTFPAVCTRIIHLGTQSSTYQGQAKMQEKVLLTWELVDDEAKNSEGKPFGISQRYTWSMHEKAVLRKHLEAWRGVPFQPSDFGPNGFNIKNVLGKACMLGIVHNEKDGKTYANISALMKLPKGMPQVQAESELIYLWLEPELFDRELFSKLSDNMQDVIRKAPEYSFAIGGTHREHIADERGGLDDEIPF